MRKPNLATSLIMLNLILIASLIFVSTSQWVKAQSTQLPSVPHFISYQGFLTDDTGEPIDGTRDIVFRIYALAYDAIVLWEEPHTDVQVSQGDFSVLLGELTPFPEWLFDTPERWLQIEIEGVYLSPRQRFTSVPYALNADKLDGYDSQEILASQLPSGAIVWFREGTEPTGYTPHPTALGEDVGPWEPIALPNSDLQNDLNTYQCNVWTGIEVLCWGVRDGQPSGIRYNYKTDTWSPISPIGAPESMYYFSSIWTGSEMIVWGGSNGNEALNSGARYNPSTDTWMPLSIVNAPYLVEHGAIWTGKEMIVWVGQEGYRYDLAKDTWMAISSEGAPSPRYNNIILWTGSEMIIWGGVNSNSTGFFRNGARYNPEDDTWISMSDVGGVGTAYTNGYPGITNSAVWTGTEMAISYGNHLLFYNPSNDTWRDKICFQSTDKNGTFPVERIALADRNIFTQTSIYDLTKDKVIARFPAWNWSKLFWTGQEILIFESPEMGGWNPNYIGMRHSIELIFPYQKD